MRKGWELKKLGEVAKYFIGLTYSPKDICNDGTIVLRSSNIQNGNLDFTDIVRVKSKIKETLYVQDGDILMCSRNGSKSLVGKTATIKGLSEKMTYGTFMTVIRSPYNAYLGYFFKSDYFRNQINKGENPVINQITKYMLDDLSIPIPPLSEQKRIVSILDRAFAAIDKARANTEKNLQNAKALFESYLQKVFEERDEDWEEKRLGEICHIIGGGTPSKDNKRYYTGSIYWATVRDMKNDLISDTEYQITDEAVKQSATNIIPKGNVVIATRVGLGKACLLIHDTAINQDLKGVIPKKGSNLSVEFLFRWLKRISKYIIEAGTGATVQGVKLTFINSLIISYPTLKKQRRIIESIDQVEKETQKLILKYQQKLTSLDELRKSILQKAFSGELLTLKEQPV